MVLRILGPAHQRTNQGGKLRPHNALFKEKKIRSEESGPNDGEGRQSHLVMQSKFERGRSYLIEGNDGDLYEAKGRLHKF
jgi:hypothetical protein